MTKKPKNSGIWHVYLLLDISAAGKPRTGRGNRATYVGITNDVNARLAKHNAGEVASTKHTQWNLLAKLPCSDQNTAAVIERWLKTGDSLEKRHEFETFFSVGGNIQQAHVDYFTRKAQLWAAQRHLRKTLKTTVKPTTHSIAFEEFNNGC